MQDIISKIDERVATLSVFERHELLTTNGTLAALLALHEDMALALRRIDCWQQTLELWLQTSGAGRSGQERLECRHGGLISEDSAGKAGQ